MTVDLSALKQLNAARWARAKLTRGAEFKPVAKRLVAAKERYMAVSDQTGVPWFFIAVTHQRESAQRWDRSLAQGDPWNKKSVHVPKGRGPFASWEEAAVDALVVCPPKAASNKDWSIGGLLTMLEQYNGLGYANKGIPSPYIWSGTDQYQRGKYIADGKFSATTVDKQLGCAGLLLAMREIDPSITLDGPPHNQESILIEAVQRRLDALGYHDVGTIDGKWGGKTAGAIAGFKNDRHIADDAEGITPRLIAELDKAEAEKWKRPIAPERKEATEAEVAKEAPEMVPVRQNKWAAIVASIVAIVSSIISSLGTSFIDALSWLGTVKAFFADVPGWAWFGIAAVIAVLFAFNSWRGTHGIATAFRTGERN